MAGLMSRNALSGRFSHHALRGAPTRIQHIALRKLIAHNGVPRRFSEGHRCCQDNNLLSSALRSAGATRGSRWCRRASSLGTASTKFKFGVRSVIHDASILAAHGAADRAHAQSMHFGRSGRDPCRSQQSPRSDDAPRHAAAAADDMPAYAAVPFRGCADQR